MTPKEDFEQKAFINYLKLNKIVYFATINETPWRKYLPKKVYDMIMANFRKMGLVSGINDVHVYLPNVLLHLEFKRRDGKGKQSDDQVKWENKVSKFPYAVYRIANSYEEGIKIVEELL